MPAPDQGMQSERQAQSPLPASESARLRICLITTEFHGLFKNGGIGTANTGLALALAQADSDVTVAFANSDEQGPRLTGVNFLDVKAGCEQLGITLDFVPASPLIARPFDDPRSASYCVYLYLKQHAFDVVYFNDCGGQGYYSLLAKRVGVFPHAPRMYVVAHGPQEWVMEINSSPYRDPWPVVTAFMERRSAALADALISPSQYLVDWMASHGWELPARVWVVPNIVTLPHSVPASTRGAKCAPITELVFFGRLEVRKGLELFCDAIDLLSPDILASLRITFLGKFSHVSGLHSGIYVVERASPWRSSLRILSTYGQEEALAYITKAGALAVIPSLAENSPCVVAECLELGIPFIATDSGGTAELVTPEDRDLCLVAPDPPKLAAKLARIIESGHQSGRPANPGAQTLAKWLRLTKTGEMEGSHAASSPASPGLPPAGSPDLPLVSVCLAPCSFTSGVESLLDSLLRQKYPRLEIILMAETPDPPSAALSLARHPIAVRVLPRTSHDSSAARNDAAAQARGQYLLFVEEDMLVLAPECVDAFVAAALATQADIITGMPSHPGDDRLAHAQPNGFLSYFPLGACAEIGAFENCFGKGAFLVSRRGFDRLGGFRPPYDRAIQDWLFLAASVLSGLHLEVVPEPLFRYKTMRPADLQRANPVDSHRRILAAYSGQQMQLFTHIIEGLLSIDRANQERLQQLLGEFGNDAGEIALRVSTSLEPNQPEALRGLVQFCLERRRIDEALDFALHNGRSVLSDAVDSAKLMAENLALDAIRRETPDLLHDVALTDDVKARVQSVSSLPAKELVQPHDGVAQSIQAGITILKAAAICPPGTKSVHAAASVEAPDPRSVFVALVASSGDARLRISEENVISDQAFWWSGWVSAEQPQAGLELSVKVSEPVDQLLDLHFLCKTIEDGSPEGKVIWTSVTAAISANETISASAIETEVVTPIPRHVVDEGALLTQHPDFPFPVFVPGHPTLLHPLPGRAALVRFAQAVPRGAHGIRSVVSIERAEAHPVQFAAWIRSSSAPVAREADFTQADAFSGWVTVRDKLRRRRFTVSLPEPASEPMDLYLATRVVEYPDVHFCHAVWHDLLILE